MADETRHRHALTSLRHRDFRYIWVGQLVSTIGDQMQNVAIAWHLFVLTNSTLKVGLVGLFGLVPFLFLSFVGGAVADRFDRRRVLVFTQTIMMSLSCVLVVTTMTDTISPTIIYAVSFISGCTRAFDAPARQALIPNLVPPDELANALTLNTMFRQMATIVGPRPGWSCPRSVRVDGYIRVERCFLPRDHRRGPGDLAAEAAGTASGRWLAARDGRPTVRAQ